MLLSGSLTGSIAANPTHVTVSTIGTTDWAYWGYDQSLSNFDHSSTGGSKISNVSEVGSGNNSGGYYEDNGTRFISFTGGTPVSSGTNDTGFIWSNGSVNSGFTFTVPASTTPQVLEVYAGGNDIQSTVSAHLSDSSASDVTLTASSSTGSFTEMYAFTFASASASQTLTISLLKTENLYGTSGSADLMAAMLFPAPASVPAAPTGLSATPGNGQVGLTWSASTGATSYNIYRGTSSGGETEVATGVTTTSYANTGLTNGTNYYYEVTAVNSSGESGKSSEVTATPTSGSVPSTPTGLTATGGTGAITLSWSTDSGASSYDLYRSTTSGGEGGTPVATGITGTSYTDSSLSSGSTYYYELTGVNSYGQGSKSTEVSATTTPSAPTGLTATGGSGEVSLSWSASTGASSYDIYRGTSSGSESGTPIATDVTTTNYTDSSVSGGTTYYYEVSAANAAGQSSKSSEATATPTVSSGGYLAGSIGSNPTYVTVSTIGTTDWAYWGAQGGFLGSDEFDHDASGGTKISNVTQVGTGYNSGGGYSTDGEQFVSFTNGTPTSSETNDPGYIWDAGSLNTGFSFTVPASTTPQVLEVYAGGYETGSTVTAQLSDSSAAAVTLTASSSSAYTEMYDFTFASASASQTLTFTMLKTTNITGTTGSTNLMAAMLFPAPASVPAAPTGLSATPGNGQVGLTWSASTGATSYNIYRGTSSGGETEVATGITTTSYTNTGLTNGTNYYYEVTAVNSSGESGKSTEVLAEPNTVLSPPTVTATGGTGQVALSWSAITGATSYNVYRGTTSGGESEIATGVTNTSYTDSSLASGTTYYYEITSVDSAGEGSKSAEASAITVPGAPATPTAIGGTGQVALSWSSVTGATSYDVYRGTSSGGETEVASGLTTTSYTDTGLSSGTTYYYELTAVNTSGESGKSSEVSATTASVPTAPNDLVATATDGQVALAWSSVTGATSYNIYRGTTSGGEGTIALGSSTTTTYTDTGLSDGTTYYYQVTAVDGAGESAKSTETSATPYPGVITGSVTDADIGANNAAIPGAVVYIDVNGTGTYATGDPTVTTDTSGNFTFSDVPLNTAEVVRVEPISGWSTLNSTSNDGSQTITLTTGATSATASFTEMRQLAAPTTLVATMASSSEVDLTWQANTTLNTGYDLQISEDGGAFTTMSTEPAATATSFAVTGLDTTDHDYVFRIAATDSNGDSEFSNTADAAAPQPPTNLQAAVDGGTPSVTLSWVAPTSGASVAGYYVYSNGGTTPVATIAATTTSWTDTSVTLGGQFNYSVSAFSAATGGFTPQSSPLTITGTVATGEHIFVSAAYALSWGEVVNPGDPETYLNLYNYQLGPSTPPTFEGESPISESASLIGSINIQSINLGYYTNLTDSPMENSPYSELFMWGALGGTPVVVTSTAVNNGGGTGGLAGTADVATSDVTPPASVGIYVQVNPGSTTMSGEVGVTAAWALDIEYNY